MGLGPGVEVLVVNQLRLAERARRPTLKGPFAAVAHIRRHIAIDVEPSVMGRPVGEAVKLFDAFRALLTDTGNGAGNDDLGDLEALAGVKAYPTRIKCAVLSWHTLKAAIDKEAEPVSTE